MVGVAAILGVDDLGKIAKRESQCATDPDNVHDEVASVQDQHTCI